MVLTRCFEDTISMLWDFHFDTAAFVADGAGENLGLIHHMTELGKKESKRRGLMATEFLKPSEKVEWSTRGLIVDVDVAFRHPRSSKPLFIIADMPHAVKTARK